MALLITLITDSMLALEAGGVTEADTRQLQDAQHKDMRQLSGLVGTLLLLVDDFLFFSKIRQSPGLVPPAAPVAFKLSVLLEEVAFVGAPLAEQKHLGFTTQCDGLDEVLLGPAKDLKRILQNLCSNAINYTTSCGVTLSAKRIERDGGAPDDPDVVRVKFQVQDTGAGISKSKQSKLWQPYVRGGTALTDSFSLQIVVCLPSLFSPFIMHYHIAMLLIQEMSKQRAQDSASTSRSGLWRPWAARCRCKARLALAPPSPSPWRSPGRKRSPINPRSKVRRVPAKLVF
jgi:hypothetical protein